MWGGCCMCAYAWVCYSCPGHWRGAHRVKICRSVLLQSSSTLAVNLWTGACVRAAVLLPTDLCGSENWDVPTMQIHNHLRSLSRSGFFGNIHTYNIRTRWQTWWDGGRASCLHALEFRMLLTHCKKSDRGKYVESSAKKSQHI